jgi:hypothetical protein
VRNGAKLLDPSDTQKRRQAIEAQAGELDRLADLGLQAIIRDQLLIEGVFSNLMALGTRAPDSLVSNVCQALVVFEQNQTTEDKMGQFDEAVEELRRFIASEKINVSVTARAHRIILRGLSSEQALAISCDDQELFCLKEDLGNHPNGWPTQVAVQPPRWSGNERPIPKSDMLTKARQWLREQRRLNG